MIATVALAAVLVVAGCSSDDSGDGGGGAGGGGTTTTTGRAGGSTTTTTGGGGGGTTTTAAGGSAGGATTTVVSGEGAAALDDLAGQINDADLGCDAVEGGREAPGAQGAAQCTLATDNPAYLYTFEDNDQRDEFVDGGGVIDCTFIFGSGVTFDYVVADGVIIRPEDNADAEAIADAVDGEVQTLGCELPDDAG